MSYSRRQSSSGFFDKFLEEIYQSLFRRFNKGPEQDFFRFYWEILHPSKQPMDQVGEITHFYMSQKAHLPQHLETYRCLSLPPNRKEVLHKFTDFVHHVTLMQYYFHSLMNAPRSRDIIHACDALQVKQHQQIYVGTLEEHSYQEVRMREIQHLFYIGRVLHTNGYLDKIPIQNPSRHVYLPSPGDQAHLEKAKKTDVLNVIIKELYEARKGRRTTDEIAAIRNLNQCIADIKVIQEDIQLTRDNFLFNERESLLMIQKQIDILQQFLSECHSNDFVFSFIPRVKVINDHRTLLSQSAEALIKSCYACRSATSRILSDGWTELEAVITKQHQEIDHEVWSLTDRLGVNRLMVLQKDYSNYEKRLENLHKLKEQMTGHIKTIEIVCQGYQVALNEMIHILQDHIDVANESNILRFLYGHKYLLSGSTLTGTALAAIPTSVVAALTISNPVTLSLLILGSIGAGVALGSGTGTVIGLAQDIFKSQPGTNATTPINTAQSKAEWDNDDTPLPSSPPAPSLRFF